MPKKINTVRLEAPLPEGLSQGLRTLWSQTFSAPYDDFKPLLAGAEIRHNLASIYLASSGDQIAGTCHLTQPRDQLVLGGLGEVATPAAFRRRGIARDLCYLALEDFAHRGGQALYLGTVNPAAARIYHRLGWRKLAGANLMAHIVDNSAPEDFLSAYFRSQDNTTIVAGTPSERIPMIPLVVCPHDDLVLDANLGLFSTRYVTQSSCMGLYPRYEKLARDGGGWFALKTTAGLLVGLASARPVQSQTYQIDAFTHKNFAPHWDELVRAALTWCNDQGAQRCWAAVSVEDEEKRRGFERLNFNATGSAACFDFSGHQVGAILAGRKLMAHRLETRLP